MAADESQWKQMRKSSKGKMKSIKKKTPPSTSALVPSSKETSGCVFNDCYCGSSPSQLLGHELNGRKQLTQLI